MTAISSDLPLAYSPAAAAKKVGVSRSRLYELIAAGDIPARKLGARTLILHADLESYLNDLPRLTGLATATPHDAA